MTLAEKLKKARENAGLSQNDVAEKLNISRQAISKWENGWSNPDIDNLVMLSDLYNISTDEWLKNNYQKNDVNPEKKEKFIYPSAETVGIAITAMLTCGIPIIGLIFNLILIGYCIWKKPKMNLIYKIIIGIFLILSLYNTWNYIDYMYFSNETVTLEKVAVSQIQKFFLYI